MIKLENKNFEAEINELGAELTRLTRKLDQRGYIWNDPENKYWPRHAPILFPAIGRSNQDQYQLDGKTFPMTLHGFARDFPFEVVNSTCDQVTLRQQATAKTLTLFPYHYELLITYKLCEDGLSTTYTVENTDGRTMPFAIGSHPGFTLQQSLSHYSLTFVEAKEPLKIFEMGPLPFRNGKVIPFSDHNQIALNYALLDETSITFNVPEATAVVLQTSDGSHTVKLSLTDFPYVTIWTPEKKQAPFLCVEPFAGLPDQAGAPSDWLKKLGNNLLKARTKQTFSYKMTLD